MFRSRRDGTAAVAALLGMLCVSAPARAQVFRLEAGSSSLYQAHGGSFYVRNDDYEGWVGLGNLDPLRVGAALRARYRRADLTFGDQTVPFHLPTDIFDTGHSFLGRGFGVDVENEGVRMFTMAGTTSTGFSTPYASAAKSEDAIGLCYLEANACSTVRFSSRSLYSGRLTSILGMDWKPHPGFQAAIAGGTGAEELYLATSALAHKGWLTVRGTYVTAGDGFRRVVVPGPQGSEMDRENIQVTVQPRPELTLSAGRNHYVQPPTKSVANSAGARGTLDQFLASGTVGGTRLSGALFFSETSGGTGVGTRGARGGMGASVSLGRDVTPYLKVSGSTLHSNPWHGATTTSLVGTFREIVSPRFELSQAVTHSPGNTSVSFGGRFISNRLSFGLDYQTIYVPFAPEDPFRQALMLNVRLQALGNFQANVGSYVGPDGKVRYTAYGSQYLYRGESSAPKQNFGLDENVVRGKVRDQTGQPIFGAALRIGGDLVYTDSGGMFFVRKKKAREYPLEVLTTEFLTSGRYELVEAPPKVKAEPEESAPEWAIVVNRLASGASDSR